MHRRLQTLFHPRQPQAKSMTNKKRKQVAPSGAHFRGYGWTLTLQRKQRVQFRPQPMTASADRTLAGPLFCSRFVFIVMRKKEMLCKALGARKALPILDLPDLKLVTLVNVERFLVVT